jgi:hypothetical protein
MSVDEAGVLWLSNPWIAAVTLVAAVALVVWCHRWLESGKAPMPRNLNVTGRRRLTRPQALKTNRVGSLSMHAPVIQFGRAGLRTRRSVGSSGVPRSAA